MQNERIRTNDQYPFMMVDLVFEILGKHVKNIVKIHYIITE